MVYCGAGTDTVHADKANVVSGDCERRSTENFIKAKFREFLFHALHSRLWA
jgi:hypothetical protein